MELIVNNKKAMTADEIDKVLSKLEPLKFADRQYKHERMKLSDFIVKMFTLNNDNQTYYAESNTVECESKKRRSMVDIYRICKFYYPRTTNIRTLSKIFGKFHQESRLNFHICGQVKRRVFRMVGFSQGVTEPKGDLVTIDEFGLNFKQFMALKDQ